jgi:hypothetical protein
LIQHKLEAVFKPFGEPDEKLCSYTQVVSPIADKRLEDDHFAGAKDGRANHCVVSSKQILLKRPVDGGRVRSQGRAFCFLITLGHSRAGRGCDHFF